MARRLVVGNKQLASVEDVCSPCLRTHDIISGSTRWLGSRLWQPDTFRPLCRARSGRPPVRDCSLRKRPLRARGTRSRPSVGACRWCESTSPTSWRANGVRPVSASCSTVVASLFCTTSCLRLAFTAGPTRVVSGGFANLEVPRWSRRALVAAHPRSSSSRPVRFGSIGSGTAGALIAPAATTLPAAGRRPRARGRCRIG